MKNIWKYIAVAALAAFTAACAPQYPEPVSAGIPQASALDVTIAVDQETNFVTFTMNTPGVVPVWIFGDQLIDGKANKKYAYTVNGLKLRFREAADYVVEVKAYNGSGISQGSILKSFTLENTYRDPFDATPYIRAVSGGSSQNWVWNSTEAGHFGCGPVGDPLGWWKCDANGKKGFLYDDVLTFDAEGHYTFDPVDGYAYANAGSEYKPEAKTGDEDYLFPVEKATTKYTFENSWNDAGIEEIFLVLEPGSILSYVPHKSAVEEPRFQVLETKTASMKKKLQLMSTVFTPNNPDGISWYYEFVPEGSVAGEEDPLFGAESKTWVLDNETQGYMGCGPSAAEPASWWSAAPHDKDGFAVTDDELTFFKDGKYVFDPGADAMVYVNKGSGYHAELLTGDEDYNAPAEKQESTYTLGSDANGDYIEFPAGVLYGYIAHGDVINDQPNRLIVAELTKDKLVLVASFEGIAWQLIYRPKNAPVENPGELKDVLVGSWTWDADVNGHFGCGPDLGNPTGWWSGEAHCKDNASMYNDVMTFTADGKYTFDPVDGMSYINQGVTIFDSRKVDSPYGDDFNITSEKVTVDYTLDEDGDFEVIKLGAGAMFSYIPTDDFMDNLTLYVRSYKKDQLILMSYTPTGNGGGAIAWQYILKRVNNE